MPLRDIEADKFPVRIRRKRECRLLLCDHRFASIDDREQVVVWLLSGEILRRPAIRHSRICPDCLLLRA
jgi:hypothetical protein